MGGRPPTIEPGGGAATPSEFGGGLATSGVGRNHSQRHHRGWPRPTPMALGVVAPPLDHLVGPPRGALGATPSLLWVASHPHNSKLSKFFLFNLSFRKIINHVGFFLVILIQFQLRYISCHQIKKYE